MSESERVLKHLLRVQLIYSLGGALVVVLAGDVLFPWLDVKIGVLGSDAIEVVSVSLVLFLISRPQVRALERSILDMDQLRARFYVESVHDALTGLHNRRHFDEFLSEEFERSKRYHQPLAMVIVDIDHFKRINDEAGHAAGDAALVELAARLSRRRRRGDLLARIGGDEFAIVAPGLEAAAARSLAEDVRRLVEVEPFTLDGEAREVTVSCGAAVLTPADGEPADLMSRADQALYRAKKTRNSIAVIE